ncbi:TPA: hypothetical protein NNM78_001903 [Pseudomonas aeruginosa]|nr:hypothetical protein [Pseudomonas aeruginosa]
MKPRTQHLTLLQLKELFYTADAKVAVVHGGLSNADATANGLSPIVQLGLSVEGLGIWNAKLFPKRTKIDVGLFLYETWSSDDYWGIPGTLQFDNELESEYPLIDKLYEMCGDNMPKLANMPTHKFGASKRIAQTVARYSTYGGISTQESIHDLFSILNENLQSHLKLWHRHFGQNNSKAELLEAFRSAQHRRPIASPSPHTFTPSKWISAIADKVKPMQENQALYGQEEGGVVFLQPDYEPHQDGGNIITERVNSLTPGYIWSREEPGIKSTLECLAFSDSELLKDIISEEDIKLFCANRIAITEHTERLIRQAFLGSSIVLAPKSLKHVETTFNYITETDVRWTAKVKTYNAEVMPNLYIAAGYEAPLMVYILPNPSPINESKIQDAFNEYIGVIDFGPSGYSALAYWSHLCLSEREEIFSHILTETVSAMINALPDWRDRY